ncbi:MAG: glycosyltransferase family 9 protein [Fusobacteriaceae bacterium]|jgi:heptosyltransferase-2|nr:glycosyltransferase family 9 protein [Fusobacteriaceae bacterium]
MKILIIRFKQIGDSILASSLCNSLKKSFPDSQIDYVLYEHVSPVFEKHKAIDNVISIKKDEQQNIFKYIKRVWQVTRTDYDIVIDVMSTLKSELFTFFSIRSPYRIGRFKKHRGYTYTHKIKEPENAKDKVDKFLKMLKPLENKYKIVYDNIFNVYITEEEKLYMKNKMLNAGINFLRPIFICAINTRVESKLYPIDKMLTIVKTIKEKYSSQIIFFYSPDEKEFALKAHKSLDNDKDIFTNIETKSIRELAMLISNCDMFFGNEGGPRHMAQGLNIPSFAIFSPNSFKKEWLPNRNEMQQGVHPEDITSDLSGLSFEEKYNLITPQYVIDKVCEIYDKIILNNVKN